MTKVLPERFRVTIQKAACCGYGLCAETCPEVFKLDANGLPSVADPLVPVGLEEKAREAAAGCPLSAITIEPA